MLLTTTDTLSRPYVEVGLVRVTFVANPPMRSAFRPSIANQTASSLDWAEWQLKEQAAKLGGMR